MSLAPIVNSLVGMTDAITQVPIKVAVFPASGWQGRSVAEALSKDDKYQVVGIARDLDSPKLNSVNVHELDLELVQGDFKDPDSYREHLQGAEAVFINTDFFSIYTDVGNDSAQAIATEIAYGKAILAECAAANVQHVIFSGLFEACETTPEMYSEGKLVMQEQIGASGLPWTIYYSSGYWENMEHSGMIQPPPAGEDEAGEIKVALPWPDAVKQEFTSVKTVGAFVKAIFDDRERFLHKEVLNTIEEATWGSFATRLADLSGKNVTTNNVSDEEWQSDATKQAVGPSWLVMDSLYHTREAHPSYRKVYYPGTTGTEVIPDLPTFEEFAKQDPYIQKVFGTK